jgi:hypothetical protein
MMLLATIGLLVVRAGPAAAQDDAGWAVMTAANNFGSGRQNYTYALNPGGQLNDALVVVNHATTPLDLAVYAADGFTTGQGQLDLRTKDAKATGVGAWIHPDRPDVTVQPGGSVEVPFTVTQPDNAAPGDYLGGILTSLTQVSQPDGTNVEHRLGIRIRLRVGGPLTPSLSVEDLHVHYSGTPNPFGTGDATVTYTIHNTGNAILVARQAVSMSGPFGRLNVSADHIDDSPQLLPGDTWKVAVPVHSVTPALRLTATVTLTPLLTDASGSIAPLTGVETTAHGWTIPWSLLLVLALCGLVIAVLVFRYRRRQVNPRREAPVE